MLRWRRCRWIVASNVLLAASTPRRSSLDGWFHCLETSAASLLQVNGPQNETVAADLARGTGLAAADMADAPGGALTAGISRRPRRGKGIRIALARAQGGR